jgi:hypothetical protein
MVIEPTVKEKVPAGHCKQATEDDELDDGL